MRKLFSLKRLMGLVVVAILSVGVLVSCSKDDDSSSNQTYSITSSWPSPQGEIDQSYIKKLEAIESARTAVDNALADALGAKNGVFTTTGDDDVKKKCEVFKTKVDALKKDFGYAVFPFTYTVKNDGTGKDVWTYTWSE